MAEVRKFGKNADGGEVWAITLQGPELRVRLLTLGAALQSVRLAGVAHDLTLGSENVADYEGAMRHHGTLIAPVVNRLRGGQASLPGGDRMQTPANEGPNSLHSGPGGTHLKTWEIAETGADFVTLSLRLSDGEAGFPGLREVQARYCLVGAAGLRLEVRASTDRPTIWNAANHSYWNLDGGKDYTGHLLHIPADRIVEVGEDLIPTGRILPTASSWADFGAPRLIRPGEPPLDTCFCLSQGPRPLSPALVLTGASGVRMRVLTTEPGVQVYDGRAALRPGGGPYEGLAVECQLWPDGPNQPGFPSYELMPGQERLQVTEWHFAKGAMGDVLA